MSEPSANPVLEFFGVALIAVGVLMAMLCGACTLVVLGSMLFGPRDTESGAYAITGAIPTLIGLVLAWVGAAMVRSGRKKTER